MEKPLSEYAKNYNCRYGVTTVCKECNRQYAKKYREDRPGLNAAMCRSYKEKNPEVFEAYRRDPENLERHRLREARRRAIKKSLPDTLTADEVGEIRTFFNGRCPISGSEANELDHFIPLVTGKGGTTKENIVLLSKSINSSKGGRNPFEWAERNLDESERLRFYCVVHYLAEINGMTYEEYEDYVYSCF